MSRSVIEHYALYTVKEDREICLFDINYNKLYMYFLRNVARRSYDIFYILYIFILVCVCVFLRGDISFVMNGKVTYGRLGFYIFCIHCV